MVLRSGVYQEWGCEVETIRLLDQCSTLAGDREIEIIITVHRQCDFQEEPSNKRVEKKGDQGQLELRCCRYSGTRIYEGGVGCFKESECINGGILAPR